MNNSNFETKYGYFSSDGKEYIIKCFDTPKPWVNVIANERYGLILSQAGGGFSWIDHSTLSVLTRWDMDLVRDNWGKWIYITDEETGDIWSATPQPTMAPVEDYSCTHGIGYSIIRQKANKIESELTITVPPIEENANSLTSTMEIWRIKFKNTSSQKRKLGVCSHFMWCLGAAPDVKREFHHLFIDTKWDSETGILTATKNIWDIPNPKLGHNNTDYPYTGFHTMWIAGKGKPENLIALGDHAQFVGRNGDWKNPSWLNLKEKTSGGFGKHTDSIAALFTTIELNPDEEIEVVFALGAGKEGLEIKEVLKPLFPKKAIDTILEKVKDSWALHLDKVQVETPDPAFNLLNNTWLTYQALSSRLWGRTGYWQQSGAFGFRDQLQDSQVFLPHAPGRCLNQIRLHARHQFADGTVYHWWHPLSEMGLITKMTDDLLWLPFVLSNYIKETAQFEVLECQEPFIDDKTPATLWDHSKRAIQKVLSRFSSRGLPLIGEGDWNDGLSACGRGEKGESIWLGHFLYLVLNEWTEIALHLGEELLAEEWKSRAAQLKEAINEFGWDGDWFLRATLDDGTLLGSKSSPEGKIFLNAQTWAVLSEIAEPERAKKIMEEVNTHLLRDYGPILFYPAYSIPDPRVGYLTRYAPGTRENGGLYSHAGVWAIQAACKLGLNDMAWEIFTKMAPPNRGMDPDLYTVEPYVTPGNVDGPDSPHFGRGGWTWYTGSAAWLRRVCLEWILGVRPTVEGLIISPALPSHWEKVTFKRPFRGDIFEITLHQQKGQKTDYLELEVDGAPHPPETPIPASGQNRLRHIVGTLSVKPESALCQKP